MSNGYRSSSIAIDARRAADAEIGNSQDRYLAQLAQQRAQAEAECLAFWQAVQVLAHQQPVDDATLDLAVLYVERHGDSVPPTLRYDQVPGYRVARARINAARRARQMD